MSDLQTQVRSYYELIDDAQQPIELADVFAVGERVRPVYDQPKPAERRNWYPSVLVAVAAAVAFLIFIGLVPFFLRDDAPLPADIPPPAQTTTSVSEATASTTTVPLAPVEAGREGEWGDYEVTQVTVVFAPVSTPDDVQCPGLEPTTESDDPYLPHAGSWYDDVCYVIPADGLLYRTGDGITWESADAADTFANLEAVNDSLISVNVDPLSSSLASPACGATPAALVIGRTTDIETWTFTRIPLDVPDPGFPIGCTAMERTQLTAGSGGMFLVGHIHHEVDIEAIIADTLTTDFSTSGYQLWMTESTIEIVTDSGEEHSIDLAGSGYLGQIEAFFEALGDDAPDLASGSFDSSIPVALWSPDGVRWSPLIREWPVRDDHIEEVSATDDGFQFAFGGDVEEEDGVVWHTEDGTTWTQRPASQRGGSDPGREEPALSVEFGTLTWTEADQGMEYPREGRPSTFLGDPVDDQTVRELFARYGPDGGNLELEPFAPAGSFTDGTSILIPVHLSATRTGGLFVSPGQGEENWQYVPGPWSSEDYYWANPFAVVPDGGFVANVTDETQVGNEGTTTYLSSDGVSWIDLGEPPYLSEVDGYIDVMMYPFAGRLRADVQLTERHGDIAAWETTDGLTWRPSQQFEGGVVETFATDFGWVAVTWLYEGGYGLWASADGDTWERLAPPEGFNELRIDGTWTPDAGGNAIYLTIEGATETRTWVGRFE